ncbi:MAG: metalloregulator ArsR/SmtB family transcription factor [Candidatus Dormibacteraeota bacterium]|nr:metalloregulator ArsR/SmtB family transcription factor [Candidatus Dormibacteraeota bacterium]
MTPRRLAAIDPEAAVDAADAMPDARVLDLVVDAFQVLADRTRAKILYALSRRPLCVRDIAIAVGSSESAISHHLRLLRDRRLVKAVRRGGNQIEYRLDDHHVANLFREAEYRADHVRKGVPDHP